MGRGSARKCTCSSPGRTKTSPRRYPTPYLMTTLLEAGKQDQDATRTFLSCHLPDCPFETPVHERAYMVTGQRWGRRRVGGRRAEREGCSICSSCSRTLDGDNVGRRCRSAAVDESCCRARPPVSNKTSSR